VWKTPPPERIGKRLRVRIAEQPVRLEHLHSEIILRHFHGMPELAGALDFEPRRA
jgi:hypothetical protein